MSVFRQLGMSGMGITMPEQNTLYCLTMLMTDVKVRVYEDKQILSTATEGAISLPSATVRSAFDDKRCSHSIVQ